MDPAQTRPKMSPKDFFIYLGIAVSLYVSAGNLLALFFSIINTAFPDPLAYDAYYYGGMQTGSAMTFTISSIVIVFPLFLFLSWYSRKDIVRTPEKAQLAIRRWFVWFTLFVAGITLVGDLVVLLNTFLSGEITIRFILKVLAVLVVAGAIFGYYFYDLRRAAKGITTVNRPLIGIAGILVLAAIILGFVVIGSPRTQRAMRFDAQRAQHLQDIQWQVLNYWQTTETLPQDLSSLNDDFGGGYITSVDPETQAPYEYRVIGPLTFEMCATFELSNKENAHLRARLPSKVAYDMGGLDPLFEHDAGRTCFERTIDPVRNPPYTR